MKKRFSIKILFLIISGFTTPMLALAEDGLNKIIPAGANVGVYINNNIEQPTKNFLNAEDLNEKNFTLAVVFILSIIAAYGVNRGYLRAIHTKSE